MKEADVGDDDNQDHWVWRYVLPFGDMLGWLDWGEGGAEGSSYSSRNGQSQSLFVEGSNVGVVPFESLHSPALSHSAGGTSYFVPPTKEKKKMMCLRKTLICSFFGGLSLLYILQVSKSATKREFDFKLMKLYVIWTSCSVPEKEMDWFGSVLSDIDFPGCTGKNIFPSNLWQKFFLLHFKSDLMRRQAVFEIDRWDFASGFFAMSEKFIFEFLDTDSSDLQNGKS